jgi:hypothetical protein
MRSKHYIGFRWLLAAVLLLLNPAIAPADPFGPWSVMSGDGRLVSSTCLGSNATPECLAETVIACGGFTVSPLAPGQPLIKHPLCDTPGVKMGANLWPVKFDERLVVSYYTFDMWVLTEADTWSQGKWRAGDLAVDIYFFSCRPELSCHEALPKDLPPESILAECPPIDCGLSADLESASGRRCPAATYFMRRAAEGWQVVDSYTDFMFVFSGNFWDPAHWYRK